MLLSLFPLYILSSSILPLISHISEQQQKQEREGKGKKRGGKVNTKILTSKGGKMEEEEEEDEQSLKKNSQTIITLHDWGTPKATFLSPSLSLSLFLIFLPLLCLISESEILHKRKRESS